MVIDMCYEFYCNMLTKIVRVMYDKKKYGAMCVGDLL